MGHFSTNTKARAWMVTVQIENMKTAGLTEEQYQSPEFLADFLSGIWCNSGKGRTAAVSICVSEKGLYHAHLALYGNLTTLKNVSKIMFNSHVEPQLGGKAALKSYLLKAPPFDEKGEQVLCTQGADNIQAAPGQRSDFDEIEEMLNQGYTPAEIMESNFSYRRFEKMIKAAFIDKRIKDTPLIKDMHNEYHVGPSGSGKTYYYKLLCDKYGPDQIYLTTDYAAGGLDLYVDLGAPPILFLDEFKGNMQYAQLLVILDKYSRTQTHCRYANTYNLWTSVIITSIYPPEEIYLSMTDAGERDRDRIDQLLRRLNRIVYHYVKDGEYKTFSVSPEDYHGYAALIKQAEESENGGFKPLNASSPFDEAERQEYKQEELNLNNSEKVIKN